MSEFMSQYRRESILIHRNREYTRKHKHMSTRQNESIFSLSTLFYRHHRRGEEGGGDVRITISVILNNVDVPISFARLELIGTNDPPHNLLHLSHSSIPTR